MTDKISEKVTFKIKKMRMEMLFQQPFFGNLTMQLKLVDATDAGWCPTAAVDGMNIYYNRDFFHDMEEQEVKFVLAHEVMHVALDHLGRRSHRDPEWWNMAADYVINALLIEEKIGKMPTKPVQDKDGTGATVQRVGLYDPKYIGWTSEAVYDDLEKRKVKKQMTLDVHLQLGKDGDGKEGQKQRGQGMPVNISEEDLKKIREEMKNKVQQSAQAAKAAGKMPGNIARLVDELVEPKISWRDLLQDTIQSCLTDDFTFMKPNRRYMNSGIFMPSLKKDNTIDLEICIDVSGSISDEMAKDFLSEIYGISETYSDFSIGILCFDTQIHNHQKFTKEDNILDYKITGGGGTDFGNSFMKYYRDHAVVPKKLIVFTDGYDSSPDWGMSIYDGRPPFDILWIITEGAKTHVKAPPGAGRWVWYTHGDGVDDVGES
jgi:predicted metal-dependent peptidase